MQFLESLLRPHGAKAVVALSSELAQRTCASVWDRVNPRVLGMNSAEARGYIRAWATDAVNKRLDDVLLRQRGIASAARPHILAEATEGIVERLLDEVLRIQRTRVVRRHAA
jgi:hypothetical protein